MASIKKTTDAKGSTVYKIQVSDGRGRRVTRSWRPEPTWSTRTVERELHKFAATLELELANGSLQTRKEAVEQKHQAEIEAAKLKTLRQYVDGVFMPAKELTISESTRSSYRQFLDLYVLPTLGDFNIEDITTAMLSKLILDHQKKQYAHSSAVKLYVILCGIFKMAYLDETLDVNPMLRVSRPKPRKDEIPQEESKKAYTVDQLRHILKCLENEPLKWQTYINVMADTGARRGEICGLRWDDINFESGYITIRRNLLYTKDKGVYLGSPKNGRSRIVDVGEDTLALLRHLRAEQLHSSLNDYVFTQDDNEDPMNPQSPTRYFAKFGRKYGIDDFHPHKLRHTSASIAILHGADIVSVSSRLGHSDTAVTLRMYAHANEESIRRAGQIVRDALKSSGEI